MRGWSDVAASARHAGTGRPRSGPGYA
jgi:hypothetical protein